MGVWAATGAGSLVWDWQFILDLYQAGGESDDPSLHSSWKVLTYGRSGLSDGPKRDVRPSEPGEFLFWGQAFRGFFHFIHADVCITHAFGSLIHFRDPSLLRSMIRGRGRVQFHAELEDLLRILDCWLAAPSLHSALRSQKYPPPYILIWLQ